MAPSAPDMRVLSCLFLTKTSKLVPAAPAPNASYKRLPAKENRTPDEDDLLNMMLHGTHRGYGQRTWPDVLAWYRPKADFLPFKRKRQRPRLSETKPLSFHVPLSMYSHCRPRRGQCIP